MFPKAAAVNGMKPLRLISLNTYLIAKTFNENRETEPETRATRIQQTLLLKHKPDLCFFQEVWGSGFQELLQAPTLQHFTVPHEPFAIFSYRPFLWAAVIGHTLYLRLMKTGGLFDLCSLSTRSATESNNSSTGAIHCIYRAKHTFTRSRSKSLKGVEATLWRIPESIWNEPGNINKQNHHFLLVFNTHLDPWHKENRKIQIQEIIQFAKKTLQAIDKTFPHKDQQQKDEHWSKRTGVVLLGDLNIKANSEEYHNLLRNDSGLQLEDFFADCGDETETYSRKNSLTCFPDDYGRIDYIFGATCPSWGYKFLPLKCECHAVLEEPTGKELSDHFALLADLAPKRMTN